MCPEKEIECPSTSNPPGDDQGGEERGNFVWGPRLPQAKLVGIVCHTILSANLFALANCVIRGSSPILPKKAPQEQEFVPSHTRYMRHLLAAEALATRPLLCYSRKKFVVCYCSRGCDACLVNHGS